jgi:hypothetical protein
MESTNTFEFIGYLLLLVVLPWGGLALHLWALFNTLRHRFDGSQKLLWIFLNVCVPLVGPLLYLVYGRKERKGKVLPDPQPNARPGGADLETKPQPRPAVALEQGIARWLQPLILSVLLVVLDEQGIVAFLVGLYLLFVYLPKSMGVPSRDYRRERLTRFAIYLCAVLMVFGLRIYNTALAKERAASVIAAVEKFKTDTGTYPDRLEQLVPGFLPRIPDKAKLTLMDSGFKSVASTGRHTLSYVTLPPFSRRVYDFESGQWHRSD